MRITERFSERHVDVDASPMLIQAGPSELCGLHIENNDESDVVLRLYDADDAGEVEPDTDPAVKTYRIPASGTLTLEATQVWLSTRTGLVACLAEDRTGAPGTPTAATASFYTTRR